MEAKSPVVPGREDWLKHEIRFGEDQVEYLTLPGLKLGEGEQILFRYELDEDDRRRIAEGQDLYVWIQNFGEKIHPMLLKIITPAELCEPPSEITEETVVSHSVS